MRTCRRTRREEGFCRRPRVVNPAHLGIDFTVENLSKSHLGQPSPHLNDAMHFPWALVISPESRFSPSLKGDRLYRIPNLTMAHPRELRHLAKPTRQVGLLPSMVLGLFAINLPVAQNP